MRTDGEALRIRGFGRRRPPRRRGRSPRARGGATDGQSAGRRAPETLSRAVAITNPRIVVVVSFDASLLDEVAAGLRPLAGTASVVLSGHGASDELRARLRIERLDGDLIDADVVARGV